MRIIAGERKGYGIAAPKGRNTRPTLDRVKEALFGIIQFDLPGAIVLDLFAGSGNLGLEALSRQAGFAVFCDASRECAAVVRQNIEKLGYLDRSLVYCLDFSAAIREAAGSGYRFDIVFLDPPYDTDLADRAVSVLLSEDALAKRALVVIEHAPEKLPQSIPGFSEADTRRYGEVAISLFRRCAS